MGENSGNCSVEKFAFAFQYSKASSPQQGLTPRGRQADGLAESSLAVGKMSKIKMAVSTVVGLCISVLVVK